ncbi:cytochrome c [Paenibacillus pasadenensis]|uniref:c-type cytochrome n=1 Tax=Paenibacillus pasadenensis TaxID=217090 RepID=UPI00203F4CB2|nr:cytochrome c [Paenibacillus pasadenensis]MCM3747198.1 cytochrome c [Paenibacillus pasadenensis]
MSRLKQKWVQFGAACAAVVMLAGCGSGAGGNADKQVSESDPMPLYKRNCMSCHGGSLQGSSGPNLQKIGSALTKDQLIETIRDGKGRMPSFGKRLKPEEIDKLATWLAEKK